MGMGGNFLSLGKSLEVGASAYVHVNGLFTEEKKINQGVRQGNPLSPLLFALSTEPLMAYMDQQIKKRTVEAISIKNQISFCQMLFSDDVGILLSDKEESFEELKQII
jgi:hypothetical protein